MLRLANLAIANSIAALLGGNQQVPIRCMVSNFKAVDGDFKVEALVLDTPKVNITGAGDGSFADESFNLRLVSRSKGFSLASLRGPIDVTGSFKKPSVHPPAGNVIARRAKLATRNRKHFSDLSGEGDEQLFEGDGRRHSRILRASVKCLRQYAMCKLSVRTLPPVEGACTNLPSPR